MRREERPYAHTHDSRDKDESHSDQRMPAPAKLQGGCRRFRAGGCGGGRRCCRARDWRRRHRGGGYHRRSWLCWRCGGRGKAQLFRRQRAAHDVRLEPFAAARTQRQCGIELPATRGAGARRFGLCFRNVHNAARPDALIKKRGTTAGNCTTRENPLQTS